MTRGQSTGYLLEQAGGSFLGDALQAAVPAEGRYCCLASSYLVEAPVAEILSFAEACYPKP